MSILGHTAWAPEGRDGQSLLVCIYIYVCICFRSQQRILSWSTLAWERQSFLWKTKNLLNTGSVHLHWLWTSQPFEMCSGYNVLMKPKTFCLYTVQFVVISQVWTFKRFRRSLQILPLTFLMLSNHLEAYVISAVTRCLQISVLSNMTYPIFVIYLIFACAIFCWKLYT